MTGAAGRAERGPQRPDTFGWCGGRLDAAVIFGHHANHEILRAVFGPTISADARRHGRPTMRRRGSFERRHIGTAARADARRRLHSAPRGARPRWRARQTGRRCRRASAASGGGAKHSRVEATPRTSAPWSVESGASPAARAAPSRAGGDPRRRRPRGGASPPPGVAARRRRPWARSGSATRRGSAPVRGPAQLRRARGARAKLGSDGASDGRSPSKRLSMISLPSRPARPTRAVRDRYRSRPPPQSRCEHRTRCADRGRRVATVVGPRRVAAALVGALDARRR